MIMYEGKFWVGWGVVRDSSTEGITDCHIARYNVERERERVCLFWMGSCMVSTLVGVLLSAAWLS